ncbi:glycosyltransferase family 2 protein [Chryseobacterium caseinilyticum]|uniref:Glycosyltransferase family 2 protein n=1 Tax=Chryseobacterium caseinilyticum TaxID=2771428 RepID=A0ABR8ZA84_9FLAO|nr:glycosyltransferase family 2 protein [Chryseobacterium caseinilyticum]MBD8082224.1 glycosyltransferase family 2 protein [Chryseobacterium caseinilyticum]
MAKVTVAIPVYNAERFLEKAITSVLAQTFHDFELWLVDDGSKDSSMAIAQKYTHDSRVKIFADGENLGLATRLNKIANEVNTEFLCRMDNDDIMHPQKLEKQLAVFSNHPEIDVLSTNLYSMDENENVVGKRFNVDNNFLGDISPVMHPTVMAKTLWFRDHPYDKNAVRVDDSDLWMRTKSQYVFRTMGEPLFFYREIGNQYYKKYFQGFPGIIYLIKKNPFSRVYLKFCFRYFVASFVFLLYYILGKEYVLIEKRNKVKLPKLHFTEYINPRE